MGTTWVASVMFVWSGSRRLPRVLEIRGREEGGGVIFEADARFFAYLPKCSTRERGEWWKDLCPVRRYEETYILHWELPGSALLNDVAV